MTLVGLTVLALILMLDWPAAFTQTYRGTIHGVVYDSSGAVLVGATVTKWNSARFMGPDLTVRQVAAFCTLSAARGGVQSNCATP